MSPSSSMGTCTTRAWQEVNVPSAPTQEGPLGEHHVTGIQEDPGQQVQRLRGAGGNHDFIGVGTDPLEGHHFADALPQPGVALGRPYCSAAAPGWRQAGRRGHPRRRAAAPG
jgi:hypothetical protein